jgi:cyclin B
MERIPKSRIRNNIPQPIPQNKSQRDYMIDNAKNIQNYNNTIFYVSRNFGRDITNTNKNNVLTTLNNLKVNTNLSKNKNINHNQSIYIKKNSSVSSLNENNNVSNYNNNNNKLTGFVSRKNYSIINYNNKTNNSRPKITRLVDNNKNTKLHNSISYGSNNIYNRPYSHNGERTSYVNNNNNMISVRVTNHNNKSFRKNNISQSNATNANNIIVKTNKTNLISYGEKRLKNSVINSKMSNDELIKHIKSTTNKENMINSMNNRLTVYKNSYKENSNININLNQSNKNKSEYKVNIIQYENKERVRRSYKTDTKRNISSHKKSSKKEKIKIKYFDETKITNVQIPKDYINTIYYNLLQEESSPSMISLKQNKNFMVDQKEINSKMRSILIDWLIDVHFKFGFTDETLFLTVSIIDRYISLSQLSRSNFQLLGISALMIACKHEEIDLPKMDDFIYITDHAYVKNEMIKMEYDILNKLNFSFLYPSPIKFFEYLSLHFNFDKKMHMMGKYLMESFLLDIKNFKYKPSIISCACAYIVMKFFKFKNYYEAYNKKFFNLKEGEYTEGNVKECAKEICLLVDNINKTNFQACLKKYSKSEQEKVAILIMNN